MFQTIGEAAGEIWRVLDEAGSLSMPAIISRVKHPQATVYMGIGWLAKEDKLVFSQTKRGMQISLKRD